MEPYDPKKRYCGPGKGVIAWLVPERLFGVDYNHACYRHDCRYERGGTGEDRRKADELLRGSIIAAFDCSLLPAFIGRWIAQRYFKAVRILGSACYNYRAVPDERFVKLVAAAKSLEAMLKTGQPCEPRRDLSQDNIGAILTYRFAIRSAEEALADAGAQDETDTA